MSINDINNASTRKSRQMSRLREERDKARNYLDIAGVMIVVIDADQTVSLINKKGTEILGYQEEEIVGKSWFDNFIPERLRETVRAAFGQLISDNVELVEYYENPVLTRSGDERLIAWHNTVLRDEEGNVIATLSSGEDITEGRKTAQALQRSEANFRALFENMPAACFAYDRSGTILQANSAAETMYGFPKEDLIGRSILETVTLPEDRKKMEETVARVFSGESIEGIEWESTRADGTTICVITNTTPVYGINGEVTMGISLNIDITERRMGEHQRREMEDHKREFYRRTILAATGGKLVMVDREEIERVAGPAEVVRDFTSASELREMRHLVEDAAKSIGMQEPRVSDLVLCAGEAITNALKHAGGGTFSIHKLPDRIIFVVSDHGPGIETLILPEATMRLGYSTIGSLGMGYKAIISMADKVYLSTGPKGTTVAVAMDVIAVPAIAGIEALPDTW